MPEYDDWVLPRFCTATPVNEPDVSVKRTWKESNGVVVPSAIRPLLWKSTELSSSVAVLNLLRKPAVPIAANPDGRSEADEAAADCPSNAAGWKAEAGRPPSVSASPALSA